MKQHGLHPVSKSARKVLELLVDGLDEPGASKKIDNAPGAFMAICVERIEETSHGLVYSVAHYYEQNGDLVPDPDITLLRSADGEFYPLSYQDGRVYRVSAELNAHGCASLDRERQTDLAYFVGEWMRNMKAQQGL